MNTDSPHIEFERLADLATGRLPREDEQTVRGHLSECDFCGLHFARLERLIGIMSDDISEDAPSYAISNAFRAYDSYAVDGGPNPVQPPISDRILAVLRLDNATLSPAFGTRAAGVGTERRMFFHAGEIDFDIRVTAEASERWVISGQIFNSPAEGDLTLTGASGEAFHSPLTPQFQFTFPPVPSGLYKVHFHSAKIDVEIPEINAGS